MRTKICLYKKNGGLAPSFFCNSVGAGVLDSPLFSHVTIFMLIFTLYKHRSNHVGDDAPYVPFLSLILWSYKFIVS